MLAVFRLIVSVQDRLHLHVQFGTDEARVRASVCLATPLELPDVKRVLKDLVQIRF